ncbi:MAG: S46 family peptidase [Porphyromonadaceae bacterium]|nr:S46 family peptidase [Porphyromonadaceae bacterium]
MRRLFGFILLLFITGVFAFSQKSGGMWIPTELNEKEMKELGLQISVSDIFNTTRPSIKDAIVQFGGGCTGEVISPRGLVLTNHHCGYGEIQSHSSVDNDLLTNGFWAKNNKEELPNPDLSVTFVTEIHNVTQAVFANTANLSEAETQKVIEKNIEELKKDFPKKSYQHIVVKPMYAGNQYYAFVSETYRDIRLVGAPPQSIGKFGSDTDNWVWPRHTGDFALFRIYANKNNEPADYSEDNVPFIPKHYLPISVKELKEGDFTFIFGYPGRTSEYLPSIAIEQIINDLNPVRIAIRDITLKTLDEKMRQDNATRIKYAAKYASISNAWKKWQGESKGLKRSNAVAKREKYENELADKNPEIKSILADFRRLYAEQKPYAVNNALWGELSRNSETFYLAALFNRISQMQANGSLTKDKSDELKAEIRQIYKDYDKTLDAKVTAKIISYYIAQLPKQFLPLDYAKYTDENRNLSLFEKWNKKSMVTNNYNDLDKIFADTQKLANSIKKDPFVIFYNNLLEAYNANVNEKYRGMQEQINGLQKRYMALQMATDKEKVFFPDANFTLRVSYGQVHGSKPADGVEYSYQTTLDGVVEKYIPDDYEFDVPQKLLDIYRKQDFVPYTNAQGKVPVAFTATNHTTGGNSGSPALDAQGNLIGLNFDRQWEGTMSDIYFDPELCRNIMVDARYILFIIDKFADADWLLDELTIVK